MNDMQASCPLCSSLGHGTAVAMHGWSLDYLPPARSVPRPAASGPATATLQLALNQPSASPSPLDAAPRAV
ncbi:hypothetical protein ULG90_20500 [Halopseudomonas pachastrellae]|nr:hypothetical protein ULG90_20500 [Halopseudomonas pachastrellae]